RRMVDTIGRCGKLLRAVVDDILDFSKMAAHAVSIERLPFAPRDAAQDVVELFAPTASERGVGLRSELAAEVPARIWGDPTRFRQILMNLVSNAVKFTSAGEVVLRARREGDLLRVEVEDTGLGIPADRVGELFRPF